MFMDEMPSVSSKRPLLPDSVDLSADNFTAPLRIDLADGSLSSSAQCSDTRRSPDGASDRTNCSSPAFFSSLTNKKHQFYPVKSAQNLMAPYQSLPSAGVPLYLYTWSLPLPDVLAQLAAVDPRCFPVTHQSIGLLFSKPISHTDYVCRIPLYLTRGMARGRVRLGNRIHLSQSEMTTVTSVHAVLSELITNIAHLSHFGMQYANSALRTAIRNLSRGEQKSKAISVRDAFDDLELDPTASNCLGLMVLVNSQSSTIDFDASQQLLRWSHARRIWNANPGLNSPDKRVQPKYGIIADYPARMGQIPVEHWPGLIARPCHLPDNDPGLLAVIGPDQKNGMDPIPDVLSQKLRDSTSASSVDNSLPTIFKASLSYADYFAIRYTPIIHQMQFIDPLLPMMGCLRLTRHQNAAQVNAGIRKENNLHQDPLLYLAGVCGVYPLSSWLLFMLTLVPMIIYQLSRALLSVELTSVLYKELHSFEGRCFFNLDTVKCTVFLPDRVDGPQCMLSELAHFTAADVNACKSVPSSDLALDEIGQGAFRNEYVPLPSDLLEATTLLGARDAVNLERLELLGDSLLQLISTLCVYGCSGPNADEGYLTARRTSIVSNANLCGIAIRMNMNKYCTAQIYSPPEHFLPPCYTVSKMVDASERDPRLYVRISDKSLADIMEALIGCFLLHLGLPAACKLLNCFGISPQPVPEANITWSELLKCPTFPHKNIECTTFLNTSPPIRRSTSNLSLGRTESISTQMPPIDLVKASTEEIFAYFVGNLKGLEEIIDYRFRDPKYLLTALTHQSSPFVNPFGSYQRLEFLGDAVLGYVITLYLYDMLPDYDPGMLTESRSTIVSNNSLACVVVEHGIHPYITHCQPALELSVSCISFIRNQSESYSQELGLLNQEVIKGLRVKTLADVFESIVGAIFVDSNGDLEVATKFIHKLLGSRISEYIRSKPVNPLRSLHILHPDLKYQQLTTEHTERSARRFKLCTSVSGEEVYTYGTTRNEARLALAERLQVPLNGHPSSTNVSSDPPLKR